MKVSQVTTDSSNTRKGIALRYRLTYGEAFEAFNLVATNLSPKVRTAVGAALLITAAVLTVLYACEPSKLEYFFLSAMALGIFAAVAYYPALKAKSGARKVARIGGEYKVELLMDGLIRTPGNAVFPVAGDKRARAFETESIFVIRPDAMNTFCLPKRVMSPDEIAAARHILAEHLKRFISLSKEPHGTASAPERA
jgi:hypothetical protein